MIRPHIILPPHHKLAPSPMTEGRANLITAVAAFSMLAVALWWAVKQGGGL